MVAQHRLGARLRAIYTTQQDDSTLAILLGAHSIGDFLGKIETVNSVAAQDSQVIAEITKFKRDVTVRAKQLKLAHARQEQVVAERAAAKQQIEAGLAERQRMLDSIKGEIVQLQAEERARQARLAAEAQARLQAQLNASHQAFQQSQRAGRRRRLGGHARRRRSASRLRRSTAASSGSRCSTSARRTSGAAPRRAASTAPGSSMFVYAQVGVSLPHHAARPVQLRRPGLPRRARAGRPRLLRRPRPRRDLHRRTASSSTLRTPATWSRSRA